MNKLKHKYYFDEVYSINYIFLLNIKSDKQIESILKKSYPETYKMYIKLKKQGENMSMENCAGKNIRSLYRHIILVKAGMSSPSFHSVLAHECLHAMFDVFDKRGVTYDPKDINEQFTYYLEMLMRVALEK